MRSKNHQNHWFLSCSSAAKADEMFPHKHNVWGKFSLKHPWVHRGVICINKTTWLLFLPLGCFLFLSVLHYTLIHRYIISVRTVYFLPSFKIEPSWTISCWKMRTEPEKYTVRINILLSHAGTKLWYFPFFLIFKEH